MKEGIDSGREEDGEGRSKQHEWKEVTKEKDRRGKKKGA